MNKVSVNFHNEAVIPGVKFLYSVVAARYNGRWIFVRHHDSETWELPAGHIEPGETPYEAACRELEEETGATDYVIDKVSVYSVTTREETRYGVLFLAEIYGMEDFYDKSEVQEILISETVPEPMTYPEIQPRFFEEVFRYIRK